MAGRPSRKSETRYKKEAEAASASLEIIAQFAVDIIGIEEEAALFASVARNAVGRLGFEDCVIYEVSADMTAIIQVAAHGVKAPKANYVESPLALKVGQGITGRVALTGESIKVNDTRKDPDHVRDLGSGRSELAVPIVLDGRVIGVIDSESSYLNFYTEQHVTVFKAIAAMLATRVKAIRLARANQVLMDEYARTNVTLTHQLQDTIDERDEAAVIRHRLGAQLLRILEALDGTVEQEEAIVEKFETLLRSAKRIVGEISEIEPETPAFSAERVDLLTVFSQIPLMLEGDEASDGVLVNIQSRPRQDYRVFGSEDDYLRLMIALASLIGEVKVDGALNIDLKSEVSRRVSVRVFGAIKRRPKPDRKTLQILLSAISRQVAEVGGQCGGNLLVNDRVELWFVFSKPKQESIALQDEIDGSDFRLE